MRPRSSWSRSWATTAAWSGPPRWRGNCSAGAFTTEPGRFVHGLPASRAPWRATVAQQAAGLTVGEGLRADFVLPARRFVDLDTLLETALGGLRDARVVGRGLPGVDVLIATRRAGAPTGLFLQPAQAPQLLAEPVPGAVALDVAGAGIVGARRDDKRAWRTRLATAWGARPVLPGPVWTEVALATGGSLLSTLEPTLDALEPCLGRDPRGRDWQEFFPNDHRIVWLRVFRAQAGGPPLRLRLGPLPSGSGG